MGRFLAAGVIALSLLALAPSASADPHVFVDRVGDAGHASDIANVWISNDLNGNYLVNTTFATPITPISNYIVYVDLDRNPKTGSPGGAEFSIGHCRGEFLVSRWNGHAWVPGNANAAEAISPNRKFVSFTFRKVDIGGDVDFDVFAVSRRMDDSNDEDDAPEGTTNIHYSFGGRVTIGFGGIVTAPAVPGGTWTVGLRALRSDNGESLQGGGAIACKATVHGEYLATKRQGFSAVARHGGRMTFAFCQFAVPKTLDGKTLYATVTVTFRGSKISHTFRTKAAAGYPATTA